jgi:thymidylate synthase (FAD)
MIESKNKASVLDHGYVRLVSYMQPAVSTPGWTADLEVVRNARVSYDADWRTGEDEGKDAKLLDYLVKNSHTSPLEAVVFTFEVKAPLFVLRQWHRHRTWSFSELSARYSELPEEFYVPEVAQITTQSTSNKQMRTDEEHPEAYHMSAAIKQTCKASFEAYKDLLKQGCPRELARGVLPLNTYSHMFCTVDLHNLAHFLRLRLHSHSQYEIRAFAQALLDLITPVVPVLTDSLKKHRLT